MVDIMGNELLEVIKWYEKQLGRKLSEAEKSSIRCQVAVNKADMPETKDLEKFGIRLGGLKFKQIPNERIKNFEKRDNEPIETSSAEVQIFADNEEDRKILEEVHGLR